MRSIKKQQKLEEMEIGKEIVVVRGTN